MDNSFVEKTIDVIGFSNPMQDLLVELDQLPRSNQNLAMREYCFQGGGNVPTALVTCGMLGMKAAMLGVVGDDILATPTWRILPSTMWDTSHVIMDPVPAPTFALR